MVPGDDITVKNELSVSLRGYKLRGMRNGGSVDVESPFEYFFFFLLFAKQHKILDKHPLLVILLLVLSLVIGVITAVLTTATSISLVSKADMV